MDADLRAALASAKALCFVCSGNAVRSAFADVWARHRGAALPVHSAAVFYEGVGMLRETRAALLARGVPEPLLDAFESHTLEELASELPAGTVVLVMSRAHRRAVASYPALTDRTFFLAAAEGEAGEILDPVEEGADFARTFERVERCVERVLAELGR